MKFNEKSTLEQSCEIKVENAYGVVIFDTYRGFMLCKLEKQTSEVVNILEDDPTNIGVHAHNNNWMAMVNSIWSVYVSIKIVWGSVSA